MNAVQKLHQLGQSIWLDNITRDLLTSGVLKQYIDYSSVTGLTSNPTIFNHAIKNTSAYDLSIRRQSKRGQSRESLFFDLALDDITEAADLFRPVWERTSGADGWVSIEVSPLLAYDTAGTLAAAKELHARANRPNVFIKIPGTQEGLQAIEQAIFAGVPINVTLLFSTDHYQAAAQAYLLGIERRIDAGLNPNICSVASVFVSRWDNAVRAKVPDGLENRLGIAIAMQTYNSYQRFIASLRCQRIYNAGARPQRLLWASTGTKDPHASDTLYVESLAAPLTINTMPEPTLKAFADHGKIAEALHSNQDFQRTLDELPELGIDINALAAELQVEGAESFAKSWDELMDVIDSKRVAIAKAG
jgi:transaldolase